MDDYVKILLIEDNQADARLLDIYLKESYSAKHELVIEDNLSKGLDQLKKKIFDIIILDLTLPDSFGLNSFKHVHHASSGTPIIVLTGLEDEAIGINAVKLGAQDFLIKEKMKNKTLNRSINYSIERSKLLNELSVNTKELEEKTFDLIVEKQKLLSAQKIAHIGSWEWDEEADEIHCSEEFFHIYGLPPGSETMTYKEFISYVHPEDQKMVMDTIEKLRITRQPFNIHHRILRTDNSVRMIHSIVELIPDKQDNIHKISGTGQDITERFREEELEKLVLAATKSNNSVVITDKDGKIEWVNEGFTRLSGYTLENVKNTYGEILKKEITADILQQKNYYNHVAKEKIPASFENLNYTKMGSRYWVITTLTPVLGKNREVERIIAIDSDITTRKQMEEELLQANKIAEHSLMKGNKALTELTIAKKQAEESMKVKEQFLANMSHEIRTPMNAIIGFTNLLLKNPYSDEHKKFIQAIKTSGENLLVIINDILDFSKIQSGKISFEQISLSLPAVLASLTVIMQEKFLEKKLRLSYNIDPKIPDKIIGDPTRLNQILMNLISNAIKFTEKGEVQIAIDLISETTDMTHLNFSVTDTGIGIPQDKIFTIFEGFTQASNNTTRKYGGTGLGLTIVKQLIELMGGSISVSSKENIGSEFVFNLKFRKHSEEDEKADREKDKIANETETVKGLNILLVEDNYLNQVLAQKVLSDWNWNVKVAENGLVAIEMVENNDFDVVLMDIQLPEMDGYEATRHIRNKMQLPKSAIPIIAMTAHAISGEANKCTNAGMNDYLSKPFDPKVLYSKITSVLRNKINVSTMNARNGNNEKKKEDDANKCIDLTYLRQLSNGSNEFVENMITLFLEQTPEAISQLEKSLVEKDWKSVRAAAHKMKPSIAFMGIEKLKNTVETTEQYAKEEIHLELLEGMIGTIRRVCDFAFKELETELKQMETKRKTNLQK